MTVEDTNASETPQIHSGTAKWDLNLTMAEAGPRLIASIEYNRELFERNSIEQILERMIRVLDAVQSNTDLVLLDIPLDADQGSFAKPQAPASKADEEQFDFDS